VCGMHLALARKYRPQTFAEVIGQDAVLKTLGTAITTGRLHHAYLFCGARGVGKTSMARIFAKSINCEKGPSLSPCQTCSVCREITEGRSLDVLEIDAASNTGVDNIRDLREQVRYLPTNGKYKIYIIDEVHMLSNAAFNALLKTLEEPPAHVLFIFATTDPQELPITVLSRCQKYDFRKMSLPILTAHLDKILASENVQAEGPAVSLIAKCAQGSVRDALSLLDQMIGYASGKLTEIDVRTALGLGDRLLIQDTFRQLLGHELKSALECLAELDARGLDLKLFSDDLLSSYRALILCQTAKVLPSNLSPSEAEFFQALVGHIDDSLLLAQYQILYQGTVELTHAEFPRTSLEITFVKMAKARDAISLTELVAQLMDKAPAPMQKSPTPAPASRYAPSAPAQPSAPTMAPKMPAPIPRPQPAVAPAKEPIMTPSSPPAQAALSSDKDWYGFVRWIQNKKPPLAALLASAEPQALTADQMAVSYAPDSPHQSLINERTAEVASFLSEYFAAPMQFVIATDSTGKKKPLVLAL